LYGAGRVLHPYLTAQDAIRYSLMVWLLGIGATL
jgi:hypothetical protein